MENSRNRLHRYLMAKSTIGAVRQNMTNARLWGADHVAVLWAVAALTDSGTCVTAKTVAPLAGFSDSTASGKLTRLRESGVLGFYHRPARCVCGSKTARHFFLDPNYVR